MCRAMSAMAGVSVVAGGLAAWWLVRRRWPAERFAQPPRSLSREEVRAVDEKAIAMGLPGVVLMENAALGLTRVVVDEIRKCRSYECRPVVIVAKTGNNGGDGFVLARQLHLLGFPVRVAYCGDRSTARRDTDAGINLSVLERMDVTIADAVNAESLTLLLKQWSNAVLIVDCLYGTGLATTMRPEAIALVEALNACQIPKVACDLPSGLDCDTGVPLGAAVCATRVSLRLGWL